MRTSHNAWLKGHSTIPAHSLVKLRKTSHTLSFMVGHEIEFRTKMAALGNGVRTHNVGSIQSHGLGVAMNLLANVYSKHDPVPLTPTACGEAKHLAEDMPHSFGRISVCFSASVKDTIGFVCHVLVVDC